MPRIRHLLPVLAAASLWAGAASACPNCKEAVAVQDETSARRGAQPSSMGNGYNYSVLFMMAMPFALLGTGAYFVTRAVKRGVLPEL